MAYGYPYGNGQQLNLDWFLEEWKNLLAAWEAEKNGIDGALQAEIDRAEAALADVFAARDAAAQSAENADASERAAAQSASDASGYLATVRADANTASNAARNAAQSESDAEDYAQTALASKNRAADSERNAAQSEANADASKRAAAQSASDADASKSAAAQSASDAEDAAASVEASAQQITTNTNNIANLQNSLNELTQAGYINPIGIFTGKLFPNKSTHQAGQMTAEINGNRITIKKVSLGSTAVNLYPSGSVPYFESVSRSPKYMYENNRMTIFESLNVQELSILLLTEKANNFPFWLIFSTYNPSTEEETSYTITPATLTDFGINYLEIPLPTSFIEKINTNKNIGLRLNFGTTGNVNIEVNSEQLIDFYIVPKAYSEASTLALTLSN